MATNGVGGGGPVNEPVTDDGTPVYSEIGPRGVGGAGQGGNNDPYSLVGPDGGGGEHVGVPVQSGGNGPHIPRKITGWRDKAKEVLGGVGNSIDPNAYQRLLGEYNHMDVNRVRDLPGFKVRDDNTYIYTAPTSPATRLVVMFMVLLFLLVVAFAVLAILQKLGIVHLPFDLHTVGIILACTVAASMLFISGFFLGLKAGEYKKYSEVQVRTMLERDGIRQEARNVTNGLKRLDKLEGKIDAAAEEIGGAILTCNIRSNAVNNENRRLVEENNRLRTHLARLGGTGPDVSSASEQ